MKNGDLPLLDAEPGSAVILRGRESNRGFRRLSRAAGTTFLDSSLSSEAASETVESYDDALPGPGNYGSPPTLGIIVA